MKVLASDFDGTLLFDGKFRDNDIDKIKEFQKAGNLFGLCSGRPFKGIVDFCKPYIEFDFYILSTGALILDKNYHVLRKKTISKEILHALFARYEGKFPIFIQANMQIYTKEMLEFEGIQHVIIESLDEVDGDIYGISMDCGNDEQARMICLDMMEHIEGVTAHQNKQFIDVTAKGCSKGWGINQLKDVLAIDCIAGIGDSYNDMPMLEVADMSFTFHDSPDMIKDKCSYVVSSVEEAIGLLEGEK